MANIDKINVNGTTYNIKDSVSGYVTSSDLTAGNVQYQSATTGGILHNASDVDTALNIVDGFASVAVSGSYNDLSNTPSLATVATSGSYNDLSNKPTIPTVPNITYGTSDPSGGSNGDIYIKYEA